MANDAHGELQGPRAIYETQCICITALLVDVRWTAYVYTVITRSSGITYIQLWLSISRCTRNLGSYSSDIDRGIRVCASSSFLR